MLLDDPLAAVDAHVGQHLFEQCIQGMLDANKCVVLVTNALQFIRDATEIVVLENGCVVENGTFHELISQKGIFCDMIDTHSDGMAAADSARGSGTDQLVLDADADPDLLTSPEEAKQPKEVAAAVTAVMAGAAPVRQRAVSSSSMSSSTSRYTREQALKAEKEAAEKEKGRLINKEDREVGNELSTPHPLCYVFTCPIP